jgi:death-on-curing protein
MKYLTKDDFIKINHRTVLSHGGNFVPPDNLLHPSSLAYIEEAAGALLFGEPIYPTIPDKAAFYMYAIITNHIFQDGNKRTGLASALVFLRVHGYALKDQLSTLDVTPTFTELNHVLYEVTMQVACGVVSLEMLRGWFQENAIQIAVK